MSAGASAGGPDRDRLLGILERLLALQVVEFKAALDAAAEAVAEAMAADKVDVFLPEPDGRTLLAVGTIDTPMGRRQVALGLDRIAIDQGGTTARIFLGGPSRLHGHLEDDPEEVRGIVEDLGVRSQLAVPLVVGGERRGVLMVCSARPEFFTEQDLRFAEAVAHWVGLVAVRAAEVERLAVEAAEQGYRAAAEGLVSAITARQREVAALIAAGKSNREIAEELVLVEGTVANHIENILARLGFRSRTQIAVWAVERGLYRSGDAPGEPA